MDDLGARRERLAQVAAEKAEQGHDVDMLRNALEQAGAEELAELAIALSDPPLRAEWPFVEPLSLDGIRAESDPTRAAGSLSTLVKESCAARIRTGFLGSVAGCILGKPVEFDPTLEELREALLRIGDWPLRDYISERAVSAGGLRRFHVDWTATVRERIRWAAPDDDINYSIVAMLALEAFRPRTRRGPDRDCLAGETFPSAGCSGQNAPRWCVGGLRRWGTGRSIRPMSEYWLRQRTRVRNAVER